MGTSISCNICMPTNEKNKKPMKMDCSLSQNLKISLMERPIIKEKTLNPLTFSFEGRKNSGVKEGFGVVKWNNESWFKGYFHNNLPNGWGKFLHPLYGKYEGEYIDDKCKGYGIYKHISDSKYEGEWKDDRQDGIGIEEWIDNSLYEGEFNFGLKDGIGKYVFPNHHIYYGQWYMNNMNGYGIYMSRNNIYLGEWENNLKNGYGEIISMNNIYYWGFFRKNCRDGFFMYYNKKSDKIILGFNIMNKMNGIIKIFNKGKEGICYQYYDGMRHKVITDNNEIYFVVGKNGLEYNKFYMYSRIQLKSYIENKIKETNIDDILKLLGRYEHRGCCCISSN